MKKEKVEGLNEEKIILEGNEIMKFYWNELKPTTLHLITYAHPRDEVIAHYVSGTNTLSYYTLNGVCLFNVDGRVEVDKNEQR